MNKEILKILIITVGVLFIGIAGRTLVGEVLSSEMEKGAKALVGVAVIVVWFIVFSIALLAIEDSKE
ncbi:hypothetical protein QK289_14225 [Exiguobacterium antarcticum]|uniref:Uncharacterized protein n=1 Tax=Exiguobacterium antarcticum TaxID=132920 RepID=A0ABT6R5D8_9BACL|nr:hypothetical protein [Exiguobacterium antarcticum]MDI3236167.1 hypothetical protein [Exiguobacterium antarcticum]